MTISFIYFNYLLMKISLNWNSLICNKKLAFHNKFCNFLEITRIISLPKIPIITSCSPAVEDEDVPDIKQLIKKKKQVFEAPRVQNYYHLEYYLTPEENSLQKVDVVTYGPAAIIFMASHDPRIVRTWIEGELTWVAWTHK